MECYKGSRMRRGDVDPRGLQSGVQRLAAMEV